MTDIGDDVLLTNTIRVGGELTAPATVTLTVTAPDGTETIPTVLTTVPGTYQATVPATAAGRWRWTWATTDPTGVDHGYFDVAGSPPPPGRTDTLATVADLEARLGRTLSDTEANRAQALLADASARVRAYTRQTFDLVLGDVAVLRPVGTKLRLPQRPVLRVTRVEAIGGAPGLPDITLPGWTFDGVDQVDIRGLSSVVLNLPEWFDDIDSAPGTWRVTYDHGYPSTPDAVLAVVCSMVQRVLTAPSPVEGMGSERIGQYQYQFHGAGSPGGNVRLTGDDKQALDDAGYRRRSTTVAVTG